MLGRRGTRTKGHRDRKKKEKQYMKCMEVKTEKTERLEEMKLLILGAGGHDRVCGEIAVSCV